MGLTTAYAGHGKLTAPEPQLGVLDALLPADLGMVYIPDSQIPARKMPGLRAVVDWLSSDAGVGVDGTIPVPDLIEAMLDYNAKKQADDLEPDDLTLVMVYDPANDSDVELARKAHEAGIKVVDLLHAGDEILFEDEAAESAEPAQEPAEPEPPAQTAPAETPGERVAAAAAKGLEAARAAQETTAPVVAAVEPGGVTITLSLSTEAIAELARAVVAAMRAEAGQPLEAPAEADAGKVASVTPITEAKSSGPVDPQPPGTVVYYYNAGEDKYRRPRGRVRDTEERVFLTPEQVEDIKARGLLP